MKNYGVFAVSLLLVFIIFVSISACGCSGVYEQYGTDAVINSIRKGKKGEEVLQDNMEKPERLLYENSDGSVSAYYFSCPVRSEFSGDKVKNEYKYTADYFEAESCGMTVLLPGKPDNKLLLRNDEGELQLSVNRSDLNSGADTSMSRVNSVFGDSKNVVDYNDAFGPSTKTVCYGTYTGLAIEMTFNDPGKFCKFNMDVDYIGFISGLYEENKKMYEALMVEDRQPYALFQNMFAFVEYKDGRNACEALTGNIYCTDKENKKYSVSTDLEQYSTKDIKSLTVCMSVDLYGEKIIFDTTVQAKAADDNYAFMGYTFTGMGKYFGEQWYYIRVSPSAVYDIAKEDIDSCYLYLKILNEGEEEPDMYIMEQDWCSFGSTWKSKIPHGNKIGPIGKKGGYLKIDYTQILKRMLERGNEDDPGIVIKAKDGDMWILATADSGIYPPIVEINFKTNKK